MLVLTRKSGQAIYLGDNIKVLVQEVRGSQVRIGIEAPNNIKVFREEIYLQILSESRQALEQTLRQNLPNDIEGTLAQFSSSLSTSEIQIEGGMVGFSKWEAFHIKAASSPFYWLASKEKPELKFLVLPVTKFKDSLFPNSNLSSKAEVFCLVTPQENFLESTLNLKAPLVINTLNNYATQLIIDDDSGTIRISLVELLAKLC